MNLLKDLQQELGLTVVFISHNLAVIHYIANRIAVMCAGRIVELATRDKLFENPVHPYTQALLRCLPTGEAGSLLGTIQGVVPSLLSEPPGCAFRERCGHAFGDCAQARVPLSDISTGREAGHLNRCLLDPSP